MTNKSVSTKSCRCYLSILSFLEEPTPKCARNATFQIARYAESSVRVNKEVPVNTVRDFRSQRPGKCGRKKADESKVNDVLVQLPLRKRKPFRHASKASGIPVGTVWNVLKREGIRRETNAIKSVLSDQNKKKRLDWCLKFIDKSTL